MKIYISDEDRPPDVKVFVRHMRIGHHWKQVMKFLVWVSLLSLLQASSAVPLEKVQEAEGEKIQTSAPDKYHNLALEQISITRHDNVYLRNDTKIRHGYFIGRPVRRFFKGKVGGVFQSIVGSILERFPPLLHWAILIADELPATENDDPTLDMGHKLSSPSTGLVIELRHNAITDIVSLNLKNWTAYQWRPKQLIYLGPVNRTDAELVTIGQIYIREILRGGSFHTFRRNCQHFTTWYIQAIWPDAPLPGPRVDQIFGKLVWWPVNWGKTGTWMWGKFTGLFSGQKDMEEVDAAAKFIKVEDLLAPDPTSAKDNATLLAGDEGSREEKGDVRPGN